MGERLGQHFLKNKHFLRRIAGALKLEPGDTMVEIGPGHGELTRELLKTPVARLIVIEKDRELVASLKKNFQMSNVKCQTNSIPAGYLPKGDKSQIQHIEVVEGDVLEILPKLIRNLKLSRCARSREAGEIRNSGYKIAGNIPFYLTGRLLRVVGELAHKPECTVLTVQKEVAERICAKPPRMNLLAASVQIWADPEIVEYIPRTAFRPKPRVDSAIIKLAGKNGEKVSNPNYQLLITNYYHLVKTLFKQPRKTVLNNLSTLLGKGEGAKAEAARILAAAGMNPRDRPQNLSVGTIIKLSEMWYTQNRR